MRTTPFHVLPKENKICHVAGFPITSKPEWTDVSFGAGCGATLSILRDRILLVQFSGCCTLHDTEYGSTSVSQVAKEAFAGGRPYVLIADLSNFPGTQLDARRYLGDNLKQQRQQLLGLILCGASPMLKLSVRVAKWLSIVKLDAQIANDQSEAVGFALEMLSTGEAQTSGSEDRLVTVTPEPLVASEAKDGVCPVTGLPITTRPEWTDIDLGEGYSVTFKFIGERILLSIPRGGSGERGMEKLMRERTRVLESMLGPDEPFLELKDYSKIQGRISGAGRDQFARGMIADKDRIMGFIGYDAPLVVKLALNVGRKLHESPFPMLIVADYQTAAKEAEETLRHHGYDKRGLTPKIITCPDWSVQLDGFSARFEVIDGDILHAATRGFLEEEHIAHIFRMHEKVMNSVPLPEGSYYFVGGVEKVGGSRKARRLYYDYVVQWYEDHPFQEYIFYGANRFLRAAINLAGPLAPFNVRMVKDIDSALELIAEEKHNGAKPAPPPASRGVVTEPLLPDQIEQYVDEMLRFVGNINWEIDGSENIERVGSHHSFSPVFDAIALIKNDHDDLIQERKGAEEALQKAYGEVEARVKERTTQLRKTNEQLEQEISERKRTERLLQALNLAAQSMGQAATPEEVFAAVAGELKKLEFACIVFLTDERQNRAFVKYWSYEGGVIEAAEKLVGLSHEDFPLPIEAVDEWKRVVRRKETVFIENVGDIVWQVLQRALPGRAGMFAGAIAKRLKASRDISAPLIVEDEVIGMFAVQSDDMTIDDIPAITAFAHQMAAAWRKAKLLQDLQKGLAERKRVEEALRERTAQLEATNNELETFSYSVSHDLRTPLRSIDGFSLALLEDCADQLNEDGQDYLRRVCAASQRMAQLIDDLLELSRVTRGEIRREPVDLSRLVQTIAAELR